MIQFKKRFFQLNYNISSSGTSAKDHDRDRRHCGGENVQGKVSFGAHTGSLEKHR